MLHFIWCPFESHWHRVEEVKCDDSRTYQPESISLNLVYTDIVIWHNLPSLPSSKVAAAAPNGGASLVYASSSLTWGPWEGYLHFRDGIRNNSAGLCEFAQNPYDLQVDCSGLEAWTLSQNALWFVKGLFLCHTSYPFPNVSPNVAKPKAPWSWKWNFTCTCQELWQIVWQLFHLHW